MLMALCTINLLLQGQFAPISLKPAPGIVQATDSVLLKMEQLMSWLQSGHHTVSFFPLVAILVSARQLRNVHQTLLSVSFREELKILWQLYGWSVVYIVTSSPGPTAIFCYSMFTFFQSLTLELAFCDSWEAWETKAFLQTRGRQRIWQWRGVGTGLSGELSIGSCSVTI